ncbi:MAG: family 43 glycosylhydrolase [Bacteroidales bacterium]|nr:family 43 glycosylhydrolase [Bacteroidales bacterium]
MKQYTKFCLRIIIVFISLLYPFFFSFSQIRKAPAPLFRDPITDGAADPVVVWNRDSKTWYMFYTQRRANVESADVAYCHGNSIGVAESEDNGRSWVYRGVLDLNFEKGHNTFWAPEIVYDNGTYHMFLAYIKGVRNHWGGVARIAHYTSKNLWDWKFKGFPVLTSDRVIDATLFKDKDGFWNMWYKDETKGSVTMVAKSKNLKKWKLDDKPAIGGNAHEGPKVFRFGNYYWMITDEWHGMRVYRSEDLKNWEKQNLILDKPASRPDDGPQGAHGDVVVVGDKAYVFYFTHPGRKSHTDAPNNEIGNLPYELRRSSIQVAPLEIKDGILVCDRSKDFDFFLPNMD